MKTNRWNVLNIWTTCIEKTRTTTTKRTTKIHRAQFPGKVQGIFFVDSIMVLNSLPVSNYCWVMRREWRHWIEKQGNIRQTVIQVLCAVFLPECLQLLGKLNDCTVVSSAQGSPHKPNDSTFLFWFFCIFFLNPHDTCQCHLSVSSAICKHRTKKPGSLGSGLVLAIQIVLS